MSHPTLRPAGLDDAEAVRFLINAGYTADGIPAALAAEEMSDFLSGPHLDPARDTRAAMVGGELVGFARVYHRPSQEREAWAYLDGMVHPDHRGRGIGRELAAWQLSGAQQRLADASDGLDRVLRVEIYPAQQDKERLFSHLGFAPVRWFEEMLRPLDDVPEAAPHGFVVVPWDSSRSAQLRELKNDAFRDHWGSTPVDQASWDQWMDDFGTRLDLSFMAVAGETIVGYSLNGHYPQDEAIHGRREGWIESLGTHRDWRGRGVASALISASCRAFREAGFTHAALGVDTDNPTGARGLYAGLGFRPDRSSKILQRNLDRLPSPPRRSG